MVVSKSFLATKQEANDKLLWTKEAKQKFKTKFNGKNFCNNFQ